MPLNYRVKDTRLDRIAVADEVFSPVRVILNWKP